MAMEALNAKVLWTRPLRHLFASSVPRRSSSFLFLGCCSISPAAAPPTSRGGGRRSSIQSSTSYRDSIRAIRLRKVEDLRGKGLESYAYKWERTHCAVLLQDIYKDLANGEEVSDEKDRVSIAGRIVARRAFGKLAFLTLRDDSGTIQERRLDDQFEQLKAVVDIGDILGAYGTVKRTEKGELSVCVNSLSILTKSLLPLPDKYHGLIDADKCYCQRGDVWKSKSDSMMKREQYHLQKLFLAGKLRLSTMSLTK